ncbi:MAG: GNAT family N-acetyltransferase [Thermoanaerobaculum sp.]|nr:GNAT family N-acetyltransferase [Thermoanaerobaculum sp.]
MWHETLSRVSLRQGQQVVIRSLAASDLEELHRFFLELPEEDRLFLEDDVTKADFVQDLLAKQAAGRVFALVAEAGGRIIGYGALYRPTYGWSTHVGRVRLAVARSWQRQGLGTALLRELVRKAQGLSLDKLVAEVVEDQVGALRAFERLGFHREATLLNHVRDRAGKKRHLVLLANDVAHIWEHMEALVADFEPSAG